MQRAIITLDVTFDETVTDDPRAWLAEYIEQQYVDDHLTVKLLRGDIVTLPPRESYRRWQVYADGVLVLDASKYTEVIQLMISLLAEYAGRDPA